MNWLLLILGGVAAFFFVRMIRQSRPAIPIADAIAALKAGTAVLIDVREPGEWESGVAKKSALLPFSDLRGGRTQWRAFLEQNKGRKLLLYCASGARSGMAATQLRGEGYDALNVGSLAAWSKADWPVCQPKHR